MSGKTDIRAIYAYIDLEAGKVGDLLYVTDRLIDWLTSSSRDQDLDFNDLEVTLRGDQVDLSCVSSRLRPRSLPIGPTLVAATAYHAYLKSRMDGNALRTISRRHRDALSQAGVDPDDATAQLAELRTSRPI